MGADELTDTVKILSHSWSKVCCTCPLGRPFSGEVSTGHSHDIVQGMGTFTSSPEGRADLGLADSGAGAVCAGREGVGGEPL